jgi:hypothetical protein
MPYQAVAPYFSHAFNRIVVQALLGAGEANMRKISAREIAMLSHER